MITYLDVNVFDSPAQSVVNTVNTVGVMGKGIALVFKKLYPEMYREYRKLCEEGKFNTGMLYIYRTPNKIIVNFPTKKHWRFPSKVEYIEAGLGKFAERYQDYGISSVSFPQLGCGHGELNWEKQVQPLMERYLKDLPIPVYIHIYPQNSDFVPERLDLEYARQVRLERQRISIDQLWNDLRQASFGLSFKSYQMSFLGAKNVDVQDEVVNFLGEDGSQIRVYREDIEDLWNVLRIRGTVSEMDVPEGIREEHATSLLFDLLDKLDYIRRIQIRKRGEVEHSQGLQYVPRPEPAFMNPVDILV